MIIILKVLVDKVDDAHTLWGISVERIYTLESNGNDRNKKHSYMSFCGFINKLDTVETQLVKLRIN